MRKQKTKTQVQEITIRKQKITVRMEETKTDQPMQKKTSRKNIAGRLDNV